MPITSKNNNIKIFDASMVKEFAANSEVLSARVDVSKTITEYEERIKKLKSDYHEEIILHNSDTLKARKISEAIDNLLNSIELENSRKEVRKSKFFSKNR